MCVIECVWSLHCVFSIKMLAPHLLLKAALKKQQVWWNLSRAVTCSRDYASLEQHSKAGSPHFPSKLWVWLAFFYLNPDVSSPSHPPLSGRARVLLSATPHQHVIVPPELQGAVRDPLGMRDNRSSMNPFPYVWHNVMSEAVQLLVMNTDRMTKVTYGDMLCLPAPVMLRTQYGPKKKKTHSASSGNRCVVVDSNETVLT